MILTQYAEYQVWIQHQMPILITFNISPDGSDLWLRQMIRGSQVEQPTRIQQVIVQGTHEADRVMAAMANLKHKRQRPYGGASRQRLP